MKKLIFIALSLSFVLYACDSSNIYRDNKTFSDLIWQKQDKAIFNFTIEKEGKYDIFLDCRYIEEYPYNIMSLNYNIKSEDNEINKALLLAIKDKDGYYIGEQMGNMIDLSRKVTKDTLLSAGEYTISIEETTSPKALAFVMEIGVRVNAVEKR